jgi:hypothetical protein
MSFRVDKYPSYASLRNSLRAALGIEEDTIINIVSIQELSHEDYECWIDGGEEEEEEDEGFLCLEALEYCGPWCDEQCDACKDYEAKHGPA